MKVTRPLEDFQVFKGACERSMQPLGGPVMAHHEARLLIRDDQRTNAPGAMYAIYKRSESRILQIVTNNVRPMPVKTEAPFSISEQLRRKFAA